MVKFKIRKVFFLLCVTLTFLIIAVIIRTHVYKTQIFAIDYGLEADQIIDYLKKWIPLSSFDVYVIFIFNELPSQSEIEDINILSKNNRRQVGFYSIFHRRFRDTRPLDMPYKFVPFKRTHIYYQDDFLDKNYFLIFNNERLVFAGKYLNLREIHFYLLKQIFPNEPISGYFINGTEYRKKIIRKLRDSSDPVSKVEDGKAVEIRDIINKYNEIYFINADCSECELKALLSDLGQQSNIQDMKPCLIFSVYANRYVLRQLFEERKINIQTFVDTNDIFDVMDLIIDRRQKSLQITHEEILKEI